MDWKERRERSRASLAVRTISHGQAYTFQIAIPNEREFKISPERYQILQESIERHQANLFPIFIRRTDAYEEEEYEVVYGKDWCYVAKQLDLQKVWVWVIEMTEAEVATVREELETIASFPRSPDTSLTAAATPEELPNPTPNPTQAPQDLKYLLHDLERSLGDRFERLTAKIDKIEENTTVAGIEELLRKQIEVICQQSRQVEKEAGLQRLQSARDRLQQYLTTLDAEMAALQRIDLAAASEEEVERSLAKVGIRTQQAKAAWKAIEFWRKEGSLAWENLEKSATASKKDRFRIDGFGKKTFDKMKAAGYL